MIDDEFWSLQAWITAPTWFLELTCNSRIRNFITFWSAHLGPPHASLTSAGMFISNSVRIQVWQNGLICKIFETGQDISYDDYCRGKGAKLRLGPRHKPRLKSHDTSEYTLIYQNTIWKKCLVCILYITVRYGIIQLTPHWGFSVTDYIKSYKPWAYILS